MALKAPRPRRARTSIPRRRSNFPRITAWTMVSHSPEPDFQLVRWTTWNLGRQRMGRHPSAQLCPMHRRPTREDSEKAPACASIGERLRCIAQGICQGHSHISASQEVVITAMHRPLCGEKPGGGARVPPLAAKPGRALRPSSGAERTSEGRSLVEPQAHVALTYVPGGSNTRARKGFWRGTSIQGSLAEVTLVPRGSK